MERGLYEQIADQELEAALEALVGRYQAQRLDEGDSHAVLAEHIAHLLTQVLRRQPAQDRLNHQVELCNRLVRVLGGSDGTVEPGAQTLPGDVRRLLSVHGDEAAPPRPDTPLSETSLLTGTRTDPSLVSQLKRALASAKRGRRAVLVHQVERHRPAARCAGAVLHSPGRGAAGADHELHGRDRPRGGGYSGSE